MIKVEKYKIGEEKVDNNYATVKLMQTYKGETKTEEVRLEKSGNKWLLPSLNSLGSVNDVNSPGTSSQAQKGQEKKEK